MAVVALGALVLLLAGVALGLAVNRGSTTTRTSSSGALTPMVQPGGTIPADEREPAAAVARALRPAVVQLDNTEGLGSGVVYDTSGLILTNAHVVGNSTSIGVQFDDGRTATGRVLGLDNDADIAVVKVDVPNLTAARLDDDQVVVGQTAIAIGSPFGLSESVTLGIVSAVDRPVPGNTNLTINMIQTDAPINPGNSGGALANRLGELIGINTSIFSQTGDNSGIGFAIPIQTAKTIADKIVAGQPLDKGYLGVTSQPPDDGSSGAEINDVTAGSPAERAGLQPQDVVVSVDGAPIRSPEDLSARIVGRSPGDTVTLTVRRNGQEVTVKATLDKRDASTSTTRRRRSSPSTTR